MRVGVELDKNLIGGNKEGEWSNNLPSFAFLAASFAFLAASFAVFAVECGARGERTIMSDAAMALIKAHWLLTILI